MIASELELESARRRLQASEGLGVTFRGGRSAALVAEARNDRSVPALCWAVPAGAQLQECGFCVPLEDSGYSIYHL